MSDITMIARTFFDACETGGGWQACERYCMADATFAAQADALAGITSLRDYTEWMKGLLTFIPNGRYEVKSFATDEERRNVTAYGVFHGAHTGEGGPCPPTGKSTATDYVYVMQFENDKIAKMTKIWNDVLAVKDLGWA
ncbi:ester cyclase [Methylorubrum sp. SB2]|uniref:ester cyclase n=1 Tax=Methylorubrum subtropicum TaxID=3138812 RepID=UPI00313ADFEF